MLPLDDLESKLGTWDIYVEGCYSQTPDFICEYVENAKIAENQLPKYSVDILDEMDHDLEEDEYRRELAMDWMDYFRNRNEPKNTS